MMQLAITWMLLHLLLGPSFVNMSGIAPSYFNYEISGRAADKVTSFTHLILRAVEVQAAPYLRGVDFTAQDPMDPRLGQQHLMPILMSFT